MGIDFAAILVRPAEVSDRALSLGIAIAAAGFDVPAPHAMVADVPGLPGWAAAFYRSGAKGLGALDETEHACDLFEEELSPALAVRAAAAAERAAAGGAEGEEAEGKKGPTLYALVYSEDLLHDDAFRFDDEGVTRRFFRQGDDGPEVGVETPGEARIEPLEVGVGEGASDEAEIAAVLCAAKPHRGSTFLAEDLRGAALPALVRALFEPERRVDARLEDPSPAAVDKAVRDLNRSLRRVDGRGASELPAAVSGVPLPVVYAAFARAYDWADPADPADLYRGLSIGAIEGVLHFLRPADLAARGADPAWSAPASRGLFPIASLARDALGASGASAGTIALDRAGERLVLVDRSGRDRPAGPTFGELIRYLALGYKARSAFEEELIQAIMLRAHLRATAFAGRR